jgi:alkylation response protein AidB-like acyl-CoA dehydrogenase
MTGRTRVGDAWQAIGVAQMSFRDTARWMGGRRTRLDEHPELWTSGYRPVDIEQVEHDLWAQRRVRRLLSRSVR